MASNIKFKRSAVQNRVPTTAQLDLGELALNTYDGKLYTEINTGSAAVIEIGSKLSSLVVDGANGGGGGDVVFHGTTAGYDLTWDYSDNSLNFADNVKLILGDNPSDLFLIHNGTYSQIAGIGNFFIQSDSLYLKDYTNGHNYLRAIRDGAVDLYHDNSIRVSTTADGADIGGTGSLKIPVGTTAQRSGSPVAGDLRYNSTTSSFEGYSTAWGDIGAGGIGVGSDASNPRTGIIQNRVGVGFTDLNIVGAGISVTGYGTTVFVDFNEFKPGSFHRTIHNYTATAGQTTFTGLNYVISEKQIAVYLNGARLSEATYTATSGTTVVLDVGASVGDEVEIVNIHTNSDVDRKVNTYTATAGQTTFTGLSYNSRQELDVYLNGIRLATADYTATSGSTVVLAVGASVNDIVDIVSTGDGVSFRSTTDASGDRFTLNNVGIGQETTPDALNVTGNVKVVGVLTATTLHGDGSNLTNTGSTLSEPSSGTQRLVTTSLTTGTMTSSGTGSELAFDYANNHLEFSDNTKATFGTGNDFELFHDGTYNRINSINHGLIYRAGFFHINNGANDESIFKATQNLGVELYYNNTKRLETTSTGASVTGNIEATGNLDLTDSGRVKLGTGDDLQIYHTGSASKIDIFTTGLEIATDGTETSAKFNRHGSVELWHDGTKRIETTSTGASITGNLAVSGVLTYDDVTNVDSVGIITARDDIKVVTDNKSITFGASNDLSMKHDGTNSYILNNTGSFIISADTLQFNNRANNETKAKFINNGAVELYYDNSLKLSTGNNGINVSGSISLVDVSRLYLGSSNDFELFHDGSNSHIKNATGILQFRSDNYHFIDKDNGDVMMKLLHDGAVELYYDNALKFKTVSGGVRTNGNLELLDNHEIQIGNGADLKIYHDGSTSYIKDTGTGNLRLATSKGEFRNAGDTETLAAFIENGAVELYHDNTKRFETTSAGTKVYGNLTFADDLNTIRLNDNYKIQLGTSQDLQIYHDGSNSRIKDTGTGSLKLSGNVVAIENSGTTETMATFTETGAVNLYHANGLRLSTASNGVSISGRLQVQCSNDAVNQLLQTTNTSGAYIQHATGASGTTIAYVGHSPHLCASPTTGNYAIRFEGDALEFSKSTSIQARITSHGGIAFGNDTAAANTLDDYEEGTWTPTIVSGGWTISSNNYMKYVKVGGLVFVQFYFGLTGSGSNTALRIGGLPFSNPSGSYSAGIADIGNGGIKGAYHRVESNSSQFEYFYSSESVGQTRIALNGNQIGAAYLIGSFSYFTAS